jgi:hypothetical protein
MSKGKLQRDDENQTRCWTATEGHIWMNDYFDDLPPRVRQRLRASPFNLCPACLVVYFMPGVHARHREYSRETALLVAIEAMESTVRKKEQRRR